MLKKTNKKISLQRWIKTLKEVLAFFATLLKDAILVYT